MSSQRLTSIVTVLLTVLWSSLSFSQDAGELLQEYERGLAPTLPKESDISIEPLPAEIKEVEGLLITLEKFEFMGNTLVGNDELIVASQPYLNREVNFIDLQKAAAALAQVYKDKGLLARVYIPEQVIAGKSLKMRIVEAKFGKLQLGDIDAAFADKADFDKWITSRQAIGAPVRPADIDRAVLLLNDLPGVGARGNLTRGAAENETDFLLSISKSATYQGNVSASNDGSRSTGANKLNGSIMFNSPWSFGDQVSSNLSLSEGSQYFRLGYSFPLYYSGLNISTAVSLMEYEVIQGVTALDPKGSSDTFQLSARYPIIRHKKHNLYASGSYNFKTFENEINSKITSDYEVFTYQAELSGNIFDQMWGGGMLQSSLSFTNGEVDLDGSPNQVSDASTVDTQGNFNKWAFSIERKQNIVKDWTMSVSHKEQIASKNLDSSERFSLGGSSTVRAYPSGEASGAEGSLSVLAVNWKARKSLNLSSFFDYGTVKINNDVDFLALPSKNEYSLKGAGVSAAYRGPKNLSGQLTLARRVGDNPSPNFDGSDKDGTLKENRFWGKVTWMF